MPAELSATETDVSDDRALLAAVSTGDSRAFGALYDRHVATVYRFAASLGLDPHAAEDVTQDVFVVAFEKAHAIHLVGGSTLPWLLVTCRNVSRSHIRKRVRDQQRSTDLDDTVATRAPGPAEEIERRLLSDAIASAISALSFDDQCLFDLCIEYGFSYAQAAEAFDVSHGVIRNRLSRIRARLRAALTPGEEEGSTS